MDEWQKETLMEVREVMVKLSQAQEILSRVVQENTVINQKLSCISYLMSLRKDMHA